MDKFSCDLAAECRSSGVVVQTVLPGLVATKLSGFKGRTSIQGPSPETFVDANLQTLGIESRTAAYWVHKIMVLI